MSMLSSRVSSVFPLGCHVPLCIHAKLFFSCVRGKLQLRARVPCFCIVIHYAALHSLNPKRAQETFVLSSMPRNDWCAPSANLQRSLAGSLLRIEVSSFNPSPPRACLRTILTPPILILLPPPLHLYRFVTFVDRLACGRSSTGCHSSHAC
ncbi:hypothetical protein LZ32DRAFT_366359 [Colletotrichum eremochloae]|nr:hypothetical protein LZ32DRAFT_366359 [Colletotrichum eremochloae]